MTLINRSTEIVRTIEMSSTESNRLLVLEYPELNEKCRELGLSYRYHEPETRYDVHAWSFYVDADQVYTLSAAVAIIDKMIEWAAEKVTTL